MTPILTRVSRLYRDITAMALQNEQRDLSI